MLRQIGIADVCEKHQKHLSWHSNALLIDLIHIHIQRVQDALVSWSLIQSTCNCRSCNSWDMMLVTGAVKLDMQSSTIGQILSLDLKETA